MKLIGRAGSPCGHTHEIENAGKWHWGWHLIPPSKGKAREGLGHTLGRKRNFVTTLESLRVWTVGPGGPGLNPGSATYSCDLGRVTLCTSATLTHRTGIRRNQPLSLGCDEDPGDIGLVMKSTPILEGPYADKGSPPHLLWSSLIGTNEPQFMTYRS